MKFHVVLVAFSDPMNIQLNHLSPHLSTHILFSPHQGFAFDKDEVDVQLVQGLAATGDVIAVSDGLTTVSV